MSTESLATFVERDPEKLGGKPVFRGTRVPVQSLFDHREAGDSIDEFLDGFQTVKREQVLGLLEACRVETLGAC